MSSRRFLPALFLLLAVPALASACLWDYDTLKQERYRFPDTLELITGKFLRHSPEFYEWRIKDRLYKLEADPNKLDYYDDLAVAYEKTGQHAKAVETMLTKEKIRPGLYETYSNLGTFHILAGDLEEGLPYIDKALAINPDAHFGRERYQKWLVEYALTRKKDGKIIFPLHKELYGANREGDGITFQEYLRRCLGKEQPLTLDESQKAVKAILGMMRFANHDNPLLLEVLGDLLFSQISPNTDAKRLAARAYLKASYAVKDETARQGYRRLADQAITFQTAGPNTNDRLPLAHLEGDFATELADADKWYAELKEKEIGWIRDGKDADVEFDRLYTEEPVAINVEPFYVGLMPRDPEQGFTLVAAIAGVGLLLLICFIVVRRVRRAFKSRELSSSVTCSQLPPGFFRGDLDGDGATAIQPLPRGPHSGSE